jgi:hypothetical protein
LFVHPLPISPLSRGSNTDDSGQPPNHRVRLGLVLLL